MNKYLKIILTEMCQAVGADFDKIDFKSENWFWKYTWTTQAENDFIDWLVNYLVKTKEARQMLMAFPSKNPRDIKNAANQFVMNYGWMTKD
jgi:hypothetical protein